MCSSDLMSAMPYGAEPDDLEASARLNVVPPDFQPGSGEVTMCFTGALQPKGRELLRAVLTAVAEIRASGSPLGARLRLRAYGTSNLTWGHDLHAVMGVARELGVESVVSEMPERVPYLQAMAVLRACDIVLVMGSVDQYYHASKLYPAIVSGRPVLALCHADASIKSVMDETNAGVCITFRDPAELTGRTADIRAAIELLAARPARPVDRATIERFTAHASTAVLARILDEVAIRPELAEAI